MKKRYELTVEFVNENFYEIDGVVFRKDGRKMSNNTKTCGYTQIFYNGNKYLLHRILWIIYNKTEIPEGYVIDHIDGNPENNSRDNLRLATRSENQHNQKLNSKNKTGVKGICISKNHGNIYHHCQIRIKNKLIQKYFPYTPEGLESAKIWIESKRQEFHGDFARHE